MLTHPPRAGPVVPQLILTFSCQSGRLLATWTKRVAELSRLLVSKQLKKKKAGGRSGRSIWKQFCRLVRHLDLCQSFEKRQAGYRPNLFPQFFLVTPPTRPWHSLLPHPPPASLPRNPLPPVGVTSPFTISPTLSLYSVQPLSTIQLLFFSFLRDRRKNLQSAFMHSQL